MVIGHWSLGKRKKRHWSLGEEKEEAERFRGWEASPRASLRSARLLKKRNFSGGSFLEAAEVAQASSPAFFPGMNRAGEPRPYKLTRDLKAPVTVAFFQSGMAAYENRLC